MTEIELKNAVIEKLAREYGIWFRDRAYYKRLCAAVETETHVRRGLKQSPFAYLTRFVEGTQPGPEPRGFPFRPLVIHEHPRLNEIVRAQPPMLTPCGKDNGSENSKVWYR